MKLASYWVDGHPAFGVVREDGVITVSERLGVRAASALLTPGSTTAAPGLSRERKSAAPQ